MKRWSVVAVVGVCFVTASVGQRSSLTLGAYETRSFVIPANTISTLPGVPVENGPDGAGSFDVVTVDPGVVVSLMIPSGQEITVANAAGSGYIFDAGTIAEGSSEFSLVPGIHTVIGIPSGQASGLYSVRLNATSVGQASSVIVTYRPTSSNVRAAATQDVPNYAVGGTVVLSGLLFDGTSPLLGSTVTATVTADISLDSQASIGNYQLAEQQVVNTQLSRYRYTATLTNTGSAASNVKATLVGLPEGVRP